MQQNTTDFIAKMAWETTKTHWKDFMILPTAVGAMVCLLMCLVFLGGASPAKSFIAFLLYIAWIVFLVAFAGALAKWCSDLYNGAKKLDIQEGLRYGLSRFWGTLGTSLLTAIKIVLWSLLLVIPGLYKAVMYSKSTRVSQLEKISGGDANRISQKMISSAGFMRTLGNYCAISLVSTLFFYLFALAAALVSGGFGLASETLGGIVFILALVVGGMVLNIFILVYGTYEYLIYRDENKAELTALMKTLASMK
ncbi:hypothetical protein IPG41_01695 [Candidatus Peregrinibacteria bacterium]|nr:MAG: hypothetical protein IPG41_01695 [Candidatus Peregrinibacteria bacterium]